MPCMHELWRDHLGLRQIEHILGIELWSPDVLPPVQCSDKESIHKNGPMRVDQEFQKKVPFSGFIYYRAHIHTRKDAKFGVDFFYCCHYFQLPSM